MVPSSVYVSEIPLHANCKFVDVQPTTFRRPFTVTVDDSTFLSPTMNQSLFPSHLPIETLQEIFLRCLPQPSYDDVDPVFWRRGTLNSARNAPLLLCHVSRWWRGVALSFPDLWTNMSVIVRLGAATPAPELVSSWLSRSGSLPLNLSLHQQNESIANRVTAGHILDIFKHYASQWGNVHFELYGPRYCRLLTVDERAAPLLRRFRLHTCFKFSEQEEKDIFGIFNHVPQLLDLHVSRIPELDLFGRSPIPIPWIQLRHLTLEYVPSIGTALHVLRQCPSLKSCSMKVDSVRGMLPYEPLEFNGLHTLFINVGFEHLASFLDQLIIPALVDLTIHVRGPLEQYAWAQDHFDAFLTRSNCRIHRLEIHDTGMTSLEFAACLQHPNLQSLIELVIDDTRDWTWDPFVTCVTLDLLTTPAFVNQGGRVVDSVESSQGRETDPRDGTKQKLCYLPNLECLTIRGSCFLSPDGTIADMAESRWRYYGEDVARLRFLDIELPMNHMEDARRLRELQSEGLELVLVQHS